ncbi:uncharacterized protein LOC123263267 [Cotesia glomerata]|uniref:Kazal-like domain-containing protein n=1 Tax=Cotesia glomerata TaxID=32391 RepID=A0AAV7IMZ1_COTGL|nr:uncharacterized protein LOC123263267 [Cotesia glomerata]KAH0554938.1 hypothetical protein KQX54_013977 [Cotesia glomerata]
MLGTLLFTYLLSISSDNILVVEAGIECPKGCPDDYNPICAHGISYKNKCVLLQQICNKKLNEQVLSETEPCPSYDIRAEAKDKSVEAIDKNGVIFRSDFAIKNEDSGESTSVEYL